MKKHIDLLKINISTDADIYILSYKLGKFLEKNNLINPAISLVARELATNILKYGTRGCIEVIYDNDMLTIVADDIGKENTELRNKKSLGIGLEIVKNNCDDLEITKKHEGGSTIKAIFMVNKPNKLLLNVGVASQPHYLESMSGDICIYKKLSDDRYFVFIADILGHGQKAYETAAHIKAYIEKSSETITIQQMLEDISSLASISRGFAGFTAYIYRDHLEYINIGNIRVWIVTHHSVSKLIENPGIIGKTPLTLKLHTERIPSEHFTIIACTDGIRRHFVPDNRAYWMWNFNPSSIANKILNDFSIKEDDSTVFVAKGGGMY